MGITYEAAQPLSPETSQGYGAAEQFTRTLPIFQRGAEAIGHLQMQGAQLRSQAAQHAAALQAQTFSQENALQAQAQQGEAQRQHEMEMQQQRLGGQFGLQAQHADLQAMLSQTQLSQSENMRLQRMRNAVGDIMAMPDLSSQEKRDAVMQLQTGIDPLQRRAAQAHVLQMQTQQRALEHQIAQADRLQRERDQYDSEGAQAHVEEIINPADGSTMTFFRGPRGERTFMGMRGGAHAVWDGNSVGGRGGSGQGTGSSGSSRGGTGGEDNMRESPINEVAVRRDVEKAIRAELLAQEQELARTDANHPQHANPALAQPQLPEAMIQHRVTERTTATIAGLRAQHAALNPPSTTPQFNQGETFQRALAEVDQLAPNAPRNARLRMARDRMEQLRREHGRTPATPARSSWETGVRPNSERGSPIPLAEPDNDWSAPANPQTLTPEVRTAVLNFDNQRQALRDLPGLPAGQRGDLLDQLGRARRLVLANGGDPRNLEGGDLSRYQAAINNAERAIRAAAQARGRPAAFRYGLSPTRGIRGAPDWWNNLAAEVAGSPERAYRLLEGSPQRPYGADPYNEAVMRNRE